MEFNALSINFHVTKAVFLSAFKNTVHVLRIFASLNFS